MIVARVVTAGLEYELRGVVGFGMGMSEESNADPRYWKISPGEGAKYWDEWRESGVAAIGWNDLGDVSNLTGPEFQVRRDELISQHDDWSEAKLNQVWDFARINEGDRVVANLGTSKVLDIGTVIGPYEFVPDAELGHRLPVQWDDLTPRQIHEGNWRNTLRRSILEPF
jgi:5-methylcytosine-specific restriction enzyme B